MPEMKCESASCKYSAELTKSAYLVVALVLLGAGAIILLYYIFSGQWNDMLAPFFNLPWNTAVTMTIIALSCIAVSFLFFYLWSNHKIV